MGYHNRLSTPEQVNRCGMSDDGHTVVRPLPGFTKQPLNHRQHQAPHRLQLPPTFFRASQVSHIRRSDGLLRRIVDRRMYKEQRNLPFHVAQNHRVQLQQFFTPYLYHQPCSFKPFYSPSLSLWLPPLRSQSLSAVSLTAVVV